MGIKWIVFEAIQNTRNLCFIRYKTLGNAPCVFYLISTHARVLNSTLNTSYMHPK